VCPNDKPAPNLLQQRLEKWANFPKEISASLAPDMLENMFVNKEPQALYSIVVDSDQQSIEAIPSIGQNLYQFRSIYYQTRQDEVDFENQLLQLIRPLVVVKFSEGWKIYLQYFVLRYAGNSKEQIESMGIFLNFDITLDDEERVFLALSKMPSVNENGARISKQFNQLFIYSRQLAEQIRRNGLRVK